MPETSIVITATDHFSAAMKTMRESSQHFTKDLDGMQKKLNELNKTKSTLKVDTDKARQELRAAEKQFSETRDVIDELILQGKQLTFEEARRNLSLVTKEASNVEKQMLKTGKAFSKTDNTATGGVSSAKSLLNGLASSGLANMFNGLAQNIANTWVSSSFGTNVGTVFSSALSSVASGAAMGSMFGSVAGLPGAAIGAAAGGLVGVVSGAMQNWGQRDDAFKSYVQEAYEGQMSAQETSLTSGSALAAQRETDRISFETLFRRGGVEDMGIVETYLSNLVEMANNTPFLYGDLTAMSKTLATYGYSAQADQAKTLSGERDYNYILDVLQTIGDAGAALGQSTGDMEAMATAIGRMKSSNKATLEYLNILNDRGIGAVGMLAEARGVDQGAMYDMISKGQVSGQAAAEIILQAMTESFSGSMLAQSRTFSGLSSTVEGLSQELDSAMGQGYNEGRMKGLTAQRDWLSGESGEAVMEANKAIGAWKAELENSKEQYIRDAVDAMMKTEEYRTAQDTGDAAEMGRLIMEAKVRGMNEYNASEGAQLALESEKSLAEAIRNDTSLDSDYWDAGYEKGQWFTKGLAAAMGEGKYFVKADIDQETGLTVYTDSYGLTADPMLVDPGGAGGLRRSGYAYGLDYVPYDNFPALLHQGERVQTAAEARGEKSSLHHINEYTIRRVTLSIGGRDMGVLGKDLFDIDRPRTHVKVQFGQNAYWVEYDPTPHPYGEVLTELLNYDVAPYEHTLCVLEQAIEEKDDQAAPRAFMNAVKGLSSLPYFRLFLSDLRQLNDGGEKDAAYMREQVSAVRFIQERYSWFLTEAFQRRAFEKKRGQRKIPLAQQIYENCLDAFVSGVSLGKSPEVDAPQVNIQYAVLEIDEEHHELVEKAPETAQIKSVLQCSSMI